MAMTLLRAVLIQLATQKTLTPHHHTTPHNATDRVRRLQIANGMRGQTYGGAHNHIERFAVIHNHFQSSLSPNTYKKKN
jgi:hypothetical protein